MSKVKINSKQIFEKHEDSFSEEHDCEIIYLEDGFKIMYDGGEIIYDGKRVFYKSGFTSLVIEEGTEKSTNMDTPYGAINIEVTGEKIIFKENPFSLEMRYFVKLGETNKYINELQILVLNK